MLRLTSTNKSIIKSSLFQKSCKRFFRSDLSGISSFNRFNLHKDPYYEMRASEYTSPKNPAVTISVTGAAGNIGYALLPRIASGEMLGPNQPVYINAIELENAIPKLEKMELDDCAFPLVKDIKITSSYEEGFENADFAMLVGSKPRLAGMERSDLLLDNGKIFQEIGKALNKTARKECKVFVVGNPANTNCLICSHNAPNIDPKNFTAMMRLDHDRGVNMATKKLGQDPQFLTEWGNHSPTMLPDLSFSRLYGENYRHTFGNMEFDEWFRKTFVPSIQTRGAAVIKARGASSAMSAANACVNHMRDWVYGTPQEGQWVSMAVRSDGSYNVPEGLWSGFPLNCPPKEDYKIVQDLPLNLYQEEMIKKTVDEMISERDAVADLLK